MEEDNCEVLETSSEEKDISQEEKKEAALPEVLAADNQKTEIVVSDTGIKIPIENTIDINTSTAKVEDFIKKGFLARVANDKDFLEKGTKTYKKKILDSTASEAKREGLKDSADTLVKLSEEAVGYFNYRKHILKEVNITEPLSIPAMKFWNIVGSIYYFVLQLFFFIKNIIGEVLSIISEVVVKISTTIKDIVTALFDTLTAIITSSSKAIRAIGFLIMGLIIFLLIVGIIYILPKFIGIDIFQLIREAIGR